jgi:hypothetical protein
MNDNEKIGAFRLKLDKTEMEIFLLNCLDKMWKVATDEYIKNAEIIGLDPTPYCMSYSLHDFMKITDGEIKEWLEKEKNRVPFDPLSQIERNSDV